ncbi:MAG: hypothetical protein II461_04700, partial [Treponema sp.]|nr:hypothetical protein [Treponema sp.]
EEKDIAFEEGKSEGIELGAKEKALESAKNLLREGDTPEKVSRCIGLSLEQVRQIAESLSVKA